MNQFRYLVYSIIFTIVGFGIWFALEDREQILFSINRIGWSGFVFISVLSLINYSLRYVRWHYLLKILQDSVPLVDGAICYLSGFALTTTPGKAGEAIRCLYFKRRHGVDHPHTLAALLSERASDALASVALASAVFYVFADYRLLGVVFTLLILTIIILVNKPALLTKFANSFRFIRIGAIQKALDGVPIFIERSASLFSVRALGVGVLIGFVSWSAEAYGFAWLAQRLGGTAPTALYMSIFAIGMIAGAASFLPGGLGGAEIVMYFLLKSTGLSDADALTVTLLCRLATLWFAVVLGLLSLLWLENFPSPAEDYP